MVNVFALYDFSQGKKIRGQFNFYKILLSGDAAIERISPFLSGFGRL